MDNRTLGIGIILLCIALLLFIELKKRYIVNTLMHQLQAGEYGDYILLLNTAFVKFVFPKYNRQYMRLNAYLFMDDDEETDRLLREMLSMKTTHKQRVNLVIKAFHFYIEQENEEQTTKLLAEIETFDDETLKQESRRTYDIYIKKSFAYINEIEEQFLHASGINKGMLAYLLAIQYENKGDIQQSAHYFDLAENNMMNSEQFIMDEKS